MTNIRKVAEAIVDTGRPAEVLAALAFLLKPSVQTPNPANEELGVQLRDVLAGLDVPPADK